MKEQMTRTNADRERIEEHWLTESELAERLRCSVKLLQKKRMSGNFISYAKFGSLVRYALTDIIAYERRSMRNNTAES